MSFPSPTSSDTTDTLPTPSLPSAFTSRATIISPTLASGPGEMTPPSEETGRAYHHHQHGEETEEEKKESGAGLGMGMVPSINVEMDETPTRPRRIPSHRTPIPGGGLNIRGLTLPTAGKISPDPTESEDKEDERDSLADLAPSPRVAAFKAALSGPYQCHQHGNLSKLPHLCDRMQLPHPGYQYPHHSDLDALTQLQLMDFTLGIYRSTSLRLVLRLVVV
jgi:hypothetical protein